MLLGSSWDAPDCPEGSDRGTGISEGVKSWQAAVSTRADFLHAHHPHDLGLLRVEAEGMRFRWHQAIAAGPLRDETDSLDDGREPPRPPLPARSDPPMSEDSGAHSPRQWLRRPS